MAQHPESNESQSLWFWQKRTAGSLFVGYAAYYICRTNLSVATPLLTDPDKGLGLTNEQVGLIGSIGVVLYAIGKIFNGLGVDYFGGRRLFLSGLLASVACTVAFGVATPLWAFMLIWAANRFFQSMGWVALVKTASRWFPVRKHATVMGILSLSFLVGDAAARLYLGAFLKVGEAATDDEWYAIFQNWRSTFFIAAATTLLITIYVSRWLRSSPGDVGCEEPHANPLNVYGGGGNSAEPLPLKELLRPLLSSPLFWLICAVNFGLTLIRETFNLWTPKFLVQEVGLGEGDAAVTSVVFPLAGAVSALAAGIMSDRLGGRHGRILLPCIFLLTGALIAMATLNFVGRPWLAMLLISSVALFLLAPYSYLSGVMALDLGGKRASSTAAGLIDSAGYFGAILSGWGIGAISSRQGWGTAFGALAGVCCLTAFAGAGYLLMHERTLRRLAATQSRIESDRATDSESTEPDRST